MCEDSEIEQEGEEICGEREISTVPGVEHGAKIQRMKAAIFIK